MYNRCILKKRGVDMKRFQIYLTERQYLILSEIAKEKGISLAEVIRRILDDKIEQVKK